MSEREPNVLVVGTNTKDSFSPKLHNAAYEEMGVDFRCEAIEVEIPGEAHEFAILKFLDEQKDTDVQALCVTMPFKEAILASEHIKGHDKAVQATGATNLVTRERDSWRANNTDWVGAIKSITELGVKIIGKTALVHGAGGAARAITYGLAGQGASDIVIVSRNFDQAERMAADFRKLWPEETGRKFTPLDSYEINNPYFWSEWCLDEADIIFNATPMGQAGTQGEGASPIKANAVSRIKTGAIIVDAVYRPRITPLLERLSERDDLTLVDGTRMLLHQAIEQIKHITGDDDVPTLTLEAVLRNHLLQEAA